ncbi:iron-sulfur cluster co-chaperone protein HscB, mitochondrial [Orussus abietinus]|uniref:iron-sulfur cluster co-chaperone protein HscB, mitochondrial n=1 Tax=Orussus abietinus TaxID=222816 RepID=UPI0006261F1F|nr:iron-sulfur cluster co-chaperone protein HscB, mitochondrial [Orussus abietinus]XP_012277072.1 iron-sulfur cluster co-chaperone protein HscB, mitochondrial [Orussus abietinus]XP_023290483.1 iron-sulfur cluster co-chaperone protein HscB, mitochondrial [Orussus abietinus]
MGSRTLHSLLRLTKRNFMYGTIDFGRNSRTYMFGVRKNVQYSPDKLRTFRYSTDCPPKCWQCNFPYKSELFCSKCKALQDPPEKMNYFQLIGVKEDYNIEIAELQKKYRQLQNILHPDRFGNKTEKEKQISENLSSLINKAYNTLLNPVDRGLYILQQYESSIPEGTTNLDSEFLMEIMEKNEEIEAVSNDKEKVFKLLEENRITLDVLTRDVSDAFRNKNIKLAKEALTKMKYYSSINLRLKQLKQDLGIVE